MRITIHATNRRQWRSGITLATLVLLLFPAAFGVRALPLSAQKGPKPEAAAQASDAQELNRLFSESEKLRNAGKYDDALALAERALALAEKLYGPEHAYIGAALNFVANIQQLKGDYAKAAVLSQRALSILEKAVGADHLDVARTLISIATDYQFMREYAKAEPLYRRGLLIAEKALGADHLEVAGALDGLARTYTAQGAYAKAEPLYQRALAIYEKALGPEHLNVASTSNDLANFYTATANYAKAEPLYHRALAIREKAFGSEHPLVAESLINLARFNNEIGDYLKAEPLFQRALAILEKSLSPNHPYIAVCLDGFSALYMHKGDYAKAEMLRLRSLSIREKTLGPEHPYVANSLINLGTLYMVKKDLAKAEPLFQRALAILEKTLGPDDLNVAVTLENLGVIGYVNKAYAKAGALFRRALAIKEKQLGPEHPDSAALLMNLADVYLLEKEFAKAEPLLQRTLAVFAKTLGPEHPDVAGPLGNLATLYAEQGDLVRAVEYRRRAEEVIEHNLVLNLITGSESQKLLYLATLSEDTSLTISLHIQAAPKDEAARRLALTTLLRRKGRALDAMADSVSALRRRFSPKDRALLDQLTNTRSQLATFVLAGPRRTKGAEYQAEIKRLEEQIEKLEAEISRQSAEFRRQSQPVTLAAVQAAIPQDAALVEFLLYHQSLLGKPGSGSPHYVAFVLGKQGEPSSVDLGEAKGINEAIRSLREALGDPNRSDVKTRARALDEKTMQSVRQLLGAKRKVLLSPDGALNLIPFAALVDENNEFLVKQYSFSYLTSGRDLLRLQTQIPSKQAAVVIADPDFNNTPFNQPGGADSRQAQRVSADTDRLATRKDAAPGPKISNLEFRPLSRLISTADEATEVQKSLPGATVLTGKAATREAVKKLSGPAILHIATHGFFLDDQSSTPESRMLIREEETEFHKSAALPGSLQNPLLRSGLFFAGANLRGVGSNDDGILTALEASGLDLYGTKLVVLSACETGLGDVKNGDGVYGLRRALVLAGAETQVMSLWSVSDKGTSELMIDYYRRLKTGEGRSEALRNAQLQMLTSPNRQHPYYWAAFIQSGEWANLDGKR